MKKNLAREINLLVFKTLFISFWTFIFIYPIAWNLSTNDELYRRYGLWKRNSMFVGPGLYPYLDVIHRSNFPLHNAALNGRNDLAAALLSAGADINSRDSFGLTPLAYAVHGRSKAEIEFYLSRNADPDAILRYGRSVIFMALERANLPLVILLCEAGASLTITDDSGVMALHLAVKHRMIKPVEIILEKGIDLNHKDNMGYTLLDHAIMSGHMGMITSIALAGAKPEFRVTPRSVEISSFLAKWQQLGDAKAAMTAEMLDRFTNKEFQQPAELPVNVDPITYPEIRGNR